MKFKILQLSGHVRAIETVLTKLIYEVASAESVSTYFCPLDEKMIFEDKRLSALINLFQFEVRYRLQSMENMNYKSNIKYVRF